MHNNPNNLVPIFLTLKTKISEIGSKKIKGKYLEDFQMIEIDEKLFNRLEKDLGKIWPKCSNFFPIVHKNPLIWKLFIKSYIPAKIQVSITFLLWRGGGEGGRGKFYLQSVYILHQKAHLD